MADLSQELPSGNVTTERIQSEPNFMFEEKKTFQSRLRTVLCCPHMIPAYGCVIFALLVLAGLPVLITQSGVQVSENESNGDNDFNQVITQTPTSQPTISPTTVESFLAELCETVVDDSFTSCLENGQVFFCDQSGFLLVDCLSGSCSCDVGIPIDAIVGDICSDDDPCTEFVV